ncbi:MAG TPA: acetylxylan esterase [Bryobacteraceae bacterium]|nr:acetylxylan esterase [Bryobacteraceae bacterium]
MRNLPVLCLLMAAPLAAAEDSFLQWMNHIAQQQLDRREEAVRAIHGPDEARRRQAVVREKILKLIGGLPDYQGPLNAKVTGAIRKPRYTIEKVIFESLPQFYITADLYRPNQPGRYPGVLFPMGHWDQGKAAAQRTAANLAEKGFVVLAYDPVGQGERFQQYDRRLKASLAGGTTDQHFQAGAQAILAGENFARYRIWDAKRALDYLVSRPEVETEKIGCTGCSGGGTLTAYISALDGRIKVAAPACYINTWRKLFTGPTGDSEQSFPDFLSSGLDVMDYIELFAPKPYLICNTVGDFFPIEGARYAYQESLDWYRLFGAEDKIRWAVGPGGHGTPLEIREAIYEWMIRWLKDGKGNFREEPVDMAPDFELLATESGHVEGREMYQVILESLRARSKPGTPVELLAELRKLSGRAHERTLAFHVTHQESGLDFRVQQLEIDVEPGLALAARLYLPYGRKPRPGVLLVEMGAEAAGSLAREGAVVLDLEPRGMPEPPNPRYNGNWLQNTRAWLIGRNLPGMRALDILYGLDVLQTQQDVDRSGLRAAARGVAGIWLLMAAAQDARLQKIWLDHTPYSLRAALEAPLTRNLHDAVMPGFALHWDLEDMVKAMAPRRVIWSDPADWLGHVMPGVAGAAYRVMDEGDARFLGELAAN